MLWCVNGPALLVSQASLLVVCLTAHIHCMWHNTTQHNTQVPGTFNNDFAEALIGAIKNAMYDIVFFPEVGMSEVCPPHPQCAPSCTLANP